MTVDILIYHGVVITMEGNGCGIINDGAVAVKGNRIEAVGPTADILKQYSAHRSIDAENKAVLPGFIDAHIHTSIAILRGASQDINGWMYSGLHPLLSEADDDDLMAGSMLNIAEAVKKGTTTFFDFSAPMLKLVENHVRAGTRAIVANTVNELASARQRTAASDAQHDAQHDTQHDAQHDTQHIETDVPGFDPAKGQQALSDTISLIEHYHDSRGGRIQCMVGPQATEMVSLPMLCELKATAEKYSLDIHMHLAQDPRETKTVLQRYQKRPVQLLEDLGYLTPRLHVAHITDTTPEERQFLAGRGVSMAQCTNSICIIDGILPPCEEYLSFGGKVALGTDQAPGNNCNNLFSEMKLTAMLHKYKHTDPTRFPAWKVLRMATIESARAMGYGDSLGSLKAGKLADIILIDLTAPALSPVLFSPVRNIVPNLVYAASGDEVQTVIIDGQVIMEDRKLLTVDETQVISCANQRAAAICTRLCTGPHTAEQAGGQSGQEGQLREMPLVKWTEAGFY